MKPIKVLFFGTSDFSKNCLQFLLSDSQFQIQAVVTKLPAPSGRKLKPTLSPVHVLAEKEQIKFFTPGTLNDPKEVKKLIQLNVDVLIVVAYGMILPPSLLNHFADRVVNIHASLLPKWRGASPIQHCLLSGDKETGVTLQKVAQKVDTGDIIHQIDFPLSASMSAVDVLEKMESLSQILLSRFLPLYLKKEIKPVHQDESKASYAGKIKNSQLKIDWSKSAKFISNQIRAFTINGGVYTFYKKKRLKIFKSTIIENTTHSYLKLNKFKVDKNFKMYGIIENYDKKYGLKIICGEGSIALTELQMQGKKKQNIHEFMRGFRIQKGERME